MSTFVEMTQTLPIRPKPSTALVKYFSTIGLVDSRLHQHHGDPVHRQPTLPLANTLRYMVESVYGPWLSPSGYDFFLAPIYGEALGLGALQYPPPRSLMPSASDMKDILVRSVVLDKKKEIKAARPPYLRV